MPSSLERRVSLLSFPLKAGRVRVGPGRAMRGVASTGKGMSRPRTASFGTRFCVVSTASKSGLGDNSCRETGMSKKRFL